MSTQLAQIAKKAQCDRKARFTSLAHLLTPEFLQETWKQLNRRGAPGIDGESIEQFERGLEHRCQEIVARLKAGSYRAPAVRRVEIPKGPGKVGTRALGIPTVEDRLLQRAVARLLEAVFEADFCDVSYGYRPGRNPHQALQAVRAHVLAKKVAYVYEADIRGYFTRVNHQWLRRMVAERIADPVILGLIGKWLNAGAMQNGVVIHTGAGTPQGGPISSVLANIYLHFSLDLWFQKKIQPRCGGEAHLVRFVDDFVVCFQHWRDADAFRRQLQERLQRFDLDLAGEKTRLLQFGRFAAEAASKHGRRPDTFEFLGFKHVCGKDRKGRFALVRIPSVKSCRKFIARTREWLCRNMHWRVADQRRQLSMMLRGFYQYFGIPHSTPKLSGVRREVLLQWRRTLIHRSQRSKITWAYLQRCRWFDLPYARVAHPLV